MHLGTTQSFPLNFRRRDTETGHIDGLPVTTQRNRPNTLRRGSVTLPIHVSFVIAKVDNSFFACELMTELDNKIAVFSSS